LKTSQHIEVCVPLFLKKTLTYSTSEPVQIGQIVEISIKEKIYLGVVWAIKNPSKTKFKSKDIMHVHDVVISESCLKFIKWVAGYTMTPLGMILKMMLPVKNIRQGASK